MKNLRILLTLIAFVAFAPLISAQTDSVPLPAAAAAPDSVAAPAPARPVTTPVDVDDEKPQVILHYYDQHGNPLDEPVMFYTELDTVQKAKSAPVYPKYNGFSVGVNFGDAIFMAFGRKYASFDVRASVSLFNWIFPTVEAGIGFADDTPDKENFTYHVAPSFYAKVGADYNFLYKSNPDYRVFLGLRAGFSKFKYDVTDITINSDYWGETMHPELRDMPATAFYGELLAGLNVKIYKGFSLGWDLRWHFNFHVTETNGSKPWFIPGYGGSSPFSVSVVASWNFGGKRF